MLLYNAENYRKAGATVGDDEYLTIQDVMDRLKVSRVTVYSHINSGRLESIKIGKLRRVTAAALRRFMDANRDHIEVKHGKPKKGS